MTLKQQILTVLRSRKWWSLVISLLTIYAAYTSGKVAPLESLIAAVSALSVYSLGAAIEGKPPD